MNPTRRSVELTPILEGQTLHAVARTQSRERISDRVHDELSAAIRDMRLAPGAPLSETDLANQLGVSRTPLREAISRLADQGVVRVLPQVGTSVALISLREVEEATFVRSSLEIAAFRRACHAHPDVSRLRVILERQESALDDFDPERFFTADEDLHHEIFRLAGFPNVWSLVRTSKMQLDRIRRLILPNAMRTRELVHEHRGIVDQLEQRDADRGASLISSHAQKVLELAPAVYAEFPQYFIDQPLPPEVTVDSSNR